MIQYSIKEIIDWVPSFSLLEIVTQKECFFCFIWVLKVPEVDTDPKGRFLSFKVTLSNENYLLVPLQGIAPENSWLGALFWRTTQNPLLIIIMIFVLTDSPQKLKLENIHDTLIILFYVSPRSPQLQRLFFFY